MLAGITAQVTFVRDSPKAIYEDIKNRIQLKTAPTKVYLVGCGDSWYCGMATRFAFEEWSGIPTEAMQALEFSRYAVKFAPKGSLVIAISNSGRIARTIECIVKANEKGLTTVVGTSNLVDGVSKEAKYTIDLAYSERRFAPGTSSYMGSLMVEYCLALYMAYVSGKMTEKQVQDKLAEISSLADAMDKTIKENMDTIEELGKKMKLDDTSTFLGGGPNYGTAFFSMAKVIEATRTNAVGQELEEWAHEQYFTTNEKTTTFVLTPPGAGVTRAREQMYAIRQMGSTCVAICDPDDAETIKEADVAIRVFGKFEEVLSPLLYCVPAELFAFHFAVAHNVTMLGFDNPKIKEVNWRQIFGSHVER